jgi:hypothetical protein
MNRVFTRALAAIFITYAVYILSAYSQRYTSIPSLAGFAVLVFYVIGNKLIFILVLFGAAYGAGGAVFARWLPKPDTLLEEGLFKAALGLVIISTAMFVLGMAGLLYAPAGYLLLAACLVVGGRELQGYFKRLLELPRTVNLGLTGVLLASVTAYLMFKGLYQAFLPPTGFDILMYHYGAPRMYIEAHRIFPTPDINGSSYPFGAEMLFMLAMLVESDISANLVNYSLAIGCGLFGYAFARRFIKGSQPFLVIAIFFAMPIVVWLLPQAYVEFAQGFYICAAVYALMVSFGEKGKNWLWVSALMAGGAMCTKYTSNLVLAVLLVGVAYKMYSLDRAGARRTASTVVVYSMLALAVVAPWYIRNVFYYGNPFFPMLVPGGGQSEMGQYWTRGMKTGLADLLMLPWNVSMYPSRFYSGELNSLGPCLLMFMPGLLLCRNMEKEVKYLMAFCLMYFAVWYLTAQNIRYIVPVGPFLAVLAGYPVGRLICGDDGFKRTAGKFIVALFCFAALFSNTVGAKVYGFPSISAKGRDSYYTEMSRQQGFLSSYEAWKWINANLPADAVIYQLWDDASVYFRDRKTLGFPTSLGSTGRDKVIYLEGHNSFGGFRPSEEIIGNLKAMGASYLLINANREGGTVPDDPYFKAHTQPILQDSGIFLYQLVDERK